MTYILGLTGGIASGKSLVSSFFKSQGVPVIDCDLIAREVVQPGTPGLADLTAHFGKSILLADDTLDRKQLGNVVFHDPAQKKILDELLDQAIRTKFLAELNYWTEEINVPLVVCDVPLLYESDYRQYVDKVMVVYVPPDLQKKRLMARNQLTEEAALSRIASQMPIEEKRQRADFVIDNQGTAEETCCKVFQWLSDHHFLAKDKG